MKHVTHAEKSLFMTDETAEWLLEYAKVLANLGLTDYVTVAAVSGDGNETKATFFLTAGIDIMAEETSTEMQAPPNTEAIEYMRSKAQALTDPPVAQTEPAAPPRDDLLDLG